MKKVLLFVCFLTATIGIVAAQQPGTLDMGFNSIENTGIYGAGTVAGISTTAVQSDGKILIGGSFTTCDGLSRNHIARLKPNGHVDTTFNPGSGLDQSLGVVGVNAIAIQNDGKIIIGGGFSIYNGVPRSRIARLNADGSLDNSFIPQLFNSQGEVNCLSIQTDGKIIVAGAFSSYGTASRQNIMRLNTNGSLDTSFAYTSGADSHIFCVTAQPDGKLLIGGKFLTYNGSLSRCIARINSSGNIDTSFHVGTGINNHVFCISLDVNSKILVGGFFTAYNGMIQNSIVRLLPNGTLDGTFNSSTGPNADIESIITTSAGKIYVGGRFTTFNGLPRNYFAELNNNGSLDNTANPSAGTNTYIYSLNTLSNGQIVVAGGFSKCNGKNATNIAALYSNADLNPNFGTGVTVANGQIYCIRSLQSGKTLIGGTQTNFNGIYCSGLGRLNTDGSLDTTFTNGEGFKTNAQVLAVEEQSDGKILVGGSFNRYNGISCSNITRINVDGSKDSTFVGAYNTGLESLLLQNDGKIILVGYLTAEQVTRLNQDGTKDTTFSPVTTNLNVTTAAIQSDGKIMIGGTFVTCNGVNRNHIARLNTNGTLDLSFTPGSGTNTGSVNYWVRKIITLLSGKILIAGDFTTYNGVTRNGIARLNSDGSLDPSFDPGTGANTAIRSMAVQTNGKILIVGEFTSYNGISRNYVARLNSDGSLDTTFDSGTGSDFYLNCVDVQSDGKIVLGGLCTHFNGVNRHGVARLYGDAIVTYLNNLEVIEVTCAPNPVLKSLHVRTSTNAGASLLYLVSVDGKQMIKPIRFENNYDLDMSSYPAGVYMVEVVNLRSGKKVVRKVVKQ